MGIQGFVRLWERICETLGEDLLGFVRIRALGEDSFMGICTRDFGERRTFMRILLERIWGIREGLWERIHGDLQGFTRLWERIHVDLSDIGRGFAGIHKDSQAFGRGFMGIRETLGEDLWGFVRLWERICGDSQGFTRLWERIHETLGDS